MSTIKFLLQYIFHPRTVGAVLPSSRRLARAMVQDVDFENARCIVEYGAGTGVFTQEILQRRRAGTVLIAFELSPKLHAMLVEKFAGYENLHIICASASDIGRHLDELGFSHACSIISGLPFASLPADGALRILTATRARLAPHGKFITFQYTRMKLPLFREYFSVVSTGRLVLRNVPPARVVSCANPPC
jgi:phospholipid N-methyltransferase